MTVAPFDLLWLEGVDATAVPDRCRGPADDADMLLGCCTELGVEGLVVKSEHAPYEPGRRSNAWRKVKVPAWRAFHAERRRPR